MTIELLESQREWLPQFKGKKIRPLGDIKTTDQTKGVAVPLRPSTSCC
jgi:hypothetical protein